MSNIWCPVFLPGHGLAGFLQKKNEIGIKSQVNAPLMAHKFRAGVTSKMDLERLVSNFLIDI